MWIVADNLQITHPVVAKALEKKNPEPLIVFAKKLADAGAEAVDINPGPLSRQPEEKMAFLVKTVQSAVSLPLLLDTTNPKALEAGLKISNNRTIINGFSLEPKKLEQILPLAADYDTEIIGFLLDAKSRVPTSESELCTLALTLFEQFQKTGLPSDRLIIDPVFAPLLWENGRDHNRNVLSLIRMLPDLTGFPIRTVGGLSNLTTGRIPKSARQPIESAFLSMLASSGLDMALLNIFHTETVRTAKACRALLGEQVFTWQQFV